MNEKRYISSEDQVKELKIRGIVMYEGDDEGEQLVENVFNRINYYNLINGYKDPFLTERYKEDTNFSELFALYNFDKNISDLFFSNILKIENVMKTVISDVFSDKYGHKHQNFLKEDNFEYPIFDESLKPKTKIKKLEEQSEIQYIVLKLKNYINDDRMVKDYIIHYKNKHKYVPLWVLTNVMTFGDTLIFFKVMKQREKVNVAKKMGVFSDKSDIRFGLEHIQNFLYVLRDFRNICAHNEKFYSFKPRNNNGIRYKVQFEKLNIMNNTKKIKTLEVSVFTLTLILKLLLEDNQFNKFFEEFKKELSLLDKNLITVNLKYILKEMDFVNDSINLSNIHQVERFFNSF